MRNIRSQNQSRRVMSEINMVPFIDVMLVMLIIFMVMAPISPSKMIPLPSVGSGVDRQSAEPLEIEILADEKIQIRSKSQLYPSNLNNLAADVIKIDPAVKATGAAASPVLITAFKTLPYESVVRVVDTLRKSGVTKVGLSVEASR